MLIDVSSVFLGNRIACLRIRAFTALLDEIEFVIFRTIFLFAIIYYYTSSLKYSIYSWYDPPFW